MDQAPRHRDRPARGQIIDFDEALLDSCPPDQLAEVMTEATLLADAFAPEGRTAQIETLARTLQSGVRELDKGRAHARLVAAALRRLARATSA